MGQKINSYQNKRFLVLGLGISGQAAAEFLLRRGAQVVGVDSNQELIAKSKQIDALRHSGLTAMPEGAFNDFSKIDCLVVSPGIKGDHPFCKQAKLLNIPIIGEVELACQEIHQPCLAVTGTNGKTTVTSLVEHVLLCQGKNAKAVGNIGIPLTAAVDEAINCETFVVELSSFQLDSLHNRFIDAGIILNITPDHLDRYASMQEYALAKIHLKDNLKPTGKLFVEDRCYQEYLPFFGNSMCYTYGYHPTCYVYTDTISVYRDGQLAFTLPPQYQHKRSHEVENLMAAYALCHEVGISGEQFLSASESFKKPAHRIEFVRTVAGVDYYDDSKGTNIDAVVRAVEAINSHIILIAGGVDKGSPYTPWKTAFGGKVKHICAIGQAATKIQLDLHPHIPVEIFPSLKAAVKHAASCAKSGDTVLLSPGCASYDMYKDYAHRGHDFQNIVNEMLLHSKEN